MSHASTRPDEKETVAFQNLSQDKRQLTLGGGVITLPSGPCISGLAFEKLNLNDESVPPRKTSIAAFSGDLQTP